MNAAIKALRGHDGQPYEPSALCEAHGGFVFTVGMEHSVDTQAIDWEPRMGSQWVDVTAAEPPLACVLCESEPNPDDLPPGAQMRIDREIDARRGK